MENEKTYGSVEAFLKSHPQATMDMLTPIGYIYLTPERGKELVEGTQIYAHPGVSGSGLMVNADEVLFQHIFQLHQDEKNPNLFYALTDFLEESLEETESAQMENMQM